MSVKIGDYEIRYVAYGDEIDSNNYNNLLDAIVSVTRSIYSFYKSYMERSGIPGRYTTYQGKWTFLSVYLDKYDRGYYRLAFPLQFYPYHHSDLKMILSCAVTALWDLIEWMEEDGYVLPDEVHTELSNVLDLLRKYPIFRKGDVIEPEHHNMLVDILVETNNLYNKIVNLSIPRGLYILSPTDWRGVLQLVCEGSIVYIKEEVPGLLHHHVLSCLRNYRCIFVNLLDDGPYRRIRTDTFRLVLYSFDRLYGLLRDNNEVIHPCFRSVLGDSVPTYYDYFVFYCRKIKPFISWAVHPINSYYTWSYRQSERGYVIEIPYDGCVHSCEWFEKYLDAMEKCFEFKSTRVIYAGGATAMDGQVNVYEVLAEVARRRKWPLTDMRG